MNGAKRLLNSFRKQSAYITQKDHLLENLTVDEYMKSAAHLKLGYKVSESEKEATVVDLFFKFQFTHKNYLFVNS